jgi:hypothetical protein
MVNFADNPWSGFLTDNPDYLYGAFMPKNATSPFADYYNSQFNKTYNNYTGQLGQMALGGQAPALSFYDYLQTYDPLKDWNLLSPSQRGERTASSLRWNVRY